MPSYKEQASKGSLRWILQSVLMMHLNLIVLMSQLAVHHICALSVMHQEQDAINLQGTSAGLLARRSPMLQLECSDTASSSTSERPGKKKVVFAKDLEIKGLPPPIEHTLPTRPILKTPTQSQEPLPALPRTMSTSAKHALLAIAHETRASRELRQGLHDSGESIRLGAKQGRHHFRNSLAQLKIGKAKEGLKEAGKAIAKTAAGVVFSPVPFMGGIAGSVYSQGKALQHRIKCERAPEAQNSRYVRDHIVDRVQRIEEDTRVDRVTNQFVNRILRPQDNTKVINVRGKKMKLMPDVEDVDPGASHTIAAGKASSSRDQTRELEEDLPMDDQRKAQIDDWLSATSSLSPESFQYHSAHSSEPRLTRSKRTSSPRMASSDSSIASSTFSLPLNSSPISSDESHLADLSDDEKFITYHVKEGQVRLPWDEEEDEEEEEVETPLTRSRHRARQLSAIPESGETTDTDNSM